MKHILDMVVHMAIGDGAAALTMDTMDGDIVHGMDGGMDIAVIVNVIL